MLKNVFNNFLYLISGYEFINIFHSKVNSIVTDSNLTLIKRYKKISGLLLLNTVISFCLLLLFPYLSKLILFSKHFIYMFFPDNDYSYIFENIDFTSINSFGISINVSSRNAALLLPSIFLYISFYLFRKLLGISKLINNDFLISQIPKLNDRNKLFLTINYWSLVIFLLCTGSRVGIFIGYAISIIYILKIKYFLFRDYYVISNNEERKYINIQLINKNK